MCRLKGLRKRLDYPEREIEGQLELKRALSDRFATPAGEQTQEDVRYAHALSRFRAAVSEGPDYVCCSCNQLWFKRSVVHVTDALVQKLSVGRARGILSDVSD